MKLAIMQPYFFPYLGYFQLINAVDKFIILDDVNFVKKGWIHKNYILDINKSKQINLSIKKVSQNKLIKDLYINNEGNWKIKFLNQIHNTYSKAPYFENRIDLIENLIFSDKKNLSSYLLSLLEELIDLFDINTKIISSSIIYEKKNLMGQNRIIDICLKEKATTYINAFGGTNLYDKDVFMNNKIELRFIKMNKISYKQGANQFVPNLSIIDVMMFNDLEKIKQMLDSYKLIYAKNSNT